MGQRPGAPLLPPEVSRLLQAAHPAERDAAWEAFLEAYSRLLLHVARETARDYDAGMDAYVFLLDQLRTDDFRRLRSYVVRDDSKFTTWLVVVARRLCLDRLRERYGRGTDAARGREARVARRQLVDLLAEELDPSALAAPSIGDNPDLLLRARELRSALVAALSGVEARDRLLLNLRFGQRLRAREIARVMGFHTAFQVYQRLDTVLRRLRRTLRQRGIEGPEP